MLYLFILLCKTFIADCIMELFPQINLLSDEDGFFFSSPEDGHGGEVGNVESLDQGMVFQTSTSHETIFVLVQIQEKLKHCSTVIFQ